ncbi:hypothetical protein [Caldalkalibacillus mannanilyticus]|uniref:hypothetical protein n=1 Tax=Caldalkalibacillus mannanilyticus TaxID=1418 RepID=UPI00054ED27D|nr:hypothetical protein [Caldalkalibacillus mannanilyticus]
MNKKKYYLSMHTSMGTVEIRDEKGDASYNFEIEATPDEIAQIEKQVVRARDADIETYVDSHFLPFGDTIDDEHKIYDQALGRIYELIYQLGTPETKQQVEQLGLVHALEGCPGKNLRDEV